MLREVLEISSSFVGTPTQVWLLYGEAKGWGVRPSSLVDLTDPYEAYCFDQAVGYLGRRIEAELEEVEGKNTAEIKHKRERVLSKYLDLGDGKKSGFADPAAMFGK